MKTFRDLGSRVVIRDINQQGIVREVRINSNGETYLITYWWEGKMQEVWLTESELENFNA